MFRIIFFICIFLNILQYLYYLSIIILKNNIDLFKSSNGFINGYHYDNIIIVVAYLLYLLHLCLLDKHNINRTLKLTFFSSLIINLIMIYLLIPRIDLVL